jgi:hypothetical protein
VRAPPLHPATPPPRHPATPPPRHPATPPSRHPGTCRWHCCRAVPAQGMRRASRPPTPATQPRNTRPRSTELQINFLDAVFGCEREIEVDRLAGCKTCDGSGVKKGTTSSTCGNCKGQGQVISVGGAPLHLRPPTAACPATHSRETSARQVAAVAVARLELLLLLQLQLGGASCSAALWQQAGSPAWRRARAAAPASGCRPSAPRPPPPTHPRRRCARRWACSSR